MRSIRQELLTLLTVLTIPVVLLAVFPYEAVGFAPAAHGGPPSASASFVRISPKDHAAALRAARSAWQVDADRDRHLRADLSVGELPAEQTAFSLDLKIAPEPTPMRTVEFGRVSYSPSLAARPLPKISREDKEEPARQAFSREELLKIE